MMKAEMDNGSVKLRTWIWSPMRKRQSENKKVPGRQGENRKRVREVSKDRRTKKKENHHTINV